MATIFPREEKAEMLFDKILANPEACRRLKRTFYDAIDSGDEFVTIFPQSSSPLHYSMHMKIKI